MIKILLSLFQLRLAAGLFALLAIGSVAAAKAPPPDPLLVHWLEAAITEILGMI